MFSDSKWIIAHKYGNRAGRGWGEIRNFLVSSWIGVVEVGFEIGLVQEPCISVHLPKREVQGRSLAIQRSFRLK